MKIKLILFLFICMGTLSYAQQTQNSPSNNREKKWLIDVTAGTNIDLIHSSSNPESKLLGSRPDVVPVFGSRVTWLFSNQTGVYAKLRFNLYKSKRSEYNQQGIIEEVLETIFLDHIFFPVSRLYPSLDAGIIYRFEQDRWKIHPGIGFGVMGYLPDSESSRTRKENNSELSVSYKQHALPIFLNMGLSTRYSISRISSLILDINFQQPLQKSYAELITHTDGVETDRKSYRTSTAGRNLNISIGYGITF